MGLFSTLGKIGKVIGAPVTGGATLLLPSADKLDGQGDAKSSSPFGDIPSGDLNQYGPSPYTSSLQSMVDGIKAPATISAPQGVAIPKGSTSFSSYAAKDVSGALPEYDAIRARLGTQYNQTQQNSQDALDRQFAAMGGGPGSGVQAKQTENLGQKIAEAKGNDLAQVNEKEAETRRGLQQREEDKAFQSGETGKQLAYNADQADVGRQFAAGQADVGRQFQAELANNANLNQYNQFKFDASSKLAGLDQGWKEAQAQAKNNEFNKAMQEYQAKHSGGFFGAGGVAGTGIEL